MVSLKERLGGLVPSLLRRKPEKPVEGVRTRLVKVKPKLDSGQDLEVQKMMMAPVLHRGQVLAERFPNLRTEGSEDGEIRTYSLYEIGERLALSFLYSGVSGIGRDYGLEAIGYLRALKGRGSVVARTEMAKVSWCHPQEEVRMALVPLIAEPGSIKKEARTSLLELMAKYDRSAPVRTAASIKLHPKAGLIT